MTCNLRPFARNSFAFLTASCALWYLSATASASPINLATNGTVGATASQSSTLGGFSASNAINGNLTDFSHTNNAVDGSGNAIDPSPSLTVDLHNDYQISQLDIYNRSDCCQSRLTDFSVTVFAPDHSTVVFSQLYFPSSGFPGDGTNANPMVINLPAGTDGRFVEVQKFNDPSNTSNPAPNTSPNSGSGNMVLSLGELQIFGPTIQPVPEPSSLVLCGLGTLGLLFAARRRSKG